MQWLSVRDFPPPPPGTKFIGFNKWGSVGLHERRCWGDVDWVVGGYKLGRDITYWLPLPEPPSKDDLG